MRIHLIVEPPVSNNQKVNFLHYIFNFVFALREFQLASRDAHTFRQTKTLLDGIWKLNKGRENKKKNYFW